MTQFIIIAYILYQLKYALCTKFSLLLNTGENTIAIKYGIFVLNASPAKFMTDIIIYFTTVYLTGKLLSQVQNYLSIFC